MFWHFIIATCYYLSRCVSLLSFHSRAQWLRETVQNKLKWGKCLCSQSLTEVISEIRPYDITNGYLCANNGPYQFLLSSRATGFEPGAAGWKAPTTTTPLLDEKFVYFYPPLLSRISEVWQMSWPQTRAMRQERNLWIALTEQVGQNFLHL